MGWDTWAVLRGRSHIELCWATLSTGRGMIEQVGRGRRRITLESSLLRRQRSETLGHELIHDELDLLWPPDAPPGLVAKGERLVERINAERCIPLGALQSYVDRRLDLGEAVTAADVAEEFDSTVHLAELCLTLLQERHQN